MMVRGAFVILLVSSSPVLGFSPNLADDDAGTGGDAGNSFETAVLLTGDGPYSGRLTFPTDTRDYYAVHVERESVLHLSIRSTQDLILEIYGPDRELYQLELSFSEFETRVIYLDRPGEWFLVVPFESVGTVRYDFSLRSGLPLGLIHEYVQSPFYVLETRWETPGQVSVIATADWVGDGQSPSTRSLLIEYRVATGDEVLEEGVLLFASSPRFARTISTHPTLVPSQQANLVGHLGDSAFGEVSMQVPRGTGWARVVAFQAGPAAAVFRTTVVSDVPIRHASTSGNDVLVWGDENSGARLQARTPIVSMAGERDLKLNLQHRFVGGFVTWLETADVTDPHGNITQLGPIGIMPFYDPLLGEWTFGLHPGVGVGPTTSKHYLVGVFPPSLGIAGQWGDD